MKRVLIYLPIVALFVVAIFYILSGTNGAISALVAYLSACLITLSSINSYRKMVEARLRDGIIPQEDRDELDKIEDPHRLYEDDEEIDEKEVSDIIKEEKAKLKQSKRGLKETVKDSAPALAPVKLLSYIILALGFIWLKSNSMMILYAYLISLSIPMFVIIYILISEKR